MVNNLLFGSFQFLTSIFCVSAHLFSVHPYIYFLYSHTAIFCAPTRLFSVHPQIYFRSSTHLFSVHPSNYLFSLDPHDYFLLIYVSIFCTSTHLFFHHPHIYFLFIMRLIFFNTALTVSLIDSFVRLFVYLFVTNKCSYTHFVISGSEVHEFVGGMARSGKGHLNRD